MLWLITAIIIVFVVFLAGFRKVALGLVVIALIGGFLLHQYNQQQQQRASTLIPASEIVVEKIALNRTYRSSYDLTGRVRNNSKTYRLDGISFNVTLRDCVGEDRSSCTVIEQAAGYATIMVPPQQSRDFIATLYFSNDEMKLKGTLVWDYEIKAIAAKRQ